MESYPIHISVGPVDEHIKASLDHLANENADIQIDAVTTANDELLDNLVAAMSDVVLITSSNDDERHTMMARIKDTTPRTRIVAITEQDNSEQIMHALQNGATGYVAQTSSDDVILDAIRTAMRHGAFLYDGHVAAIILDEFRKYSKKLNHLSPWERIILDRITQGHRQQEFSDEFGIEKNTLEKHLGSIATKMYELNRHGALPEKWSDRLRRLVGIDKLWPNKRYDMQVAFFTATRVKSYRFLIGFNARFIGRHPIPMIDGARHWHH